MTHRYPARVVRVWSESRSLRGLSFVSEEVSRGHRRPGQYVRVVVGGEENPYAIASEPGAPAMELLFKRETALTETMAALREGDRILVGAPEGKGFPVELHEGHDLILCAAGSGIAPLRAVIREVLPIRDRYGAISLYYGQRDVADFAYLGEHPGWREAGVNIVLVTSVEGRRVPAAILADAPAVARAVAYVAGMKGMIEGVRDALVGLGLAPERLFLNT